MRLITYGGRTQNLRAWAKEIGITHRALWSRLAKGWPLEQALSAGKGESFKGQPALAPLARKAGVTYRVATYRRSAGHPMGEGFAARYFTASAPTPAHIQRPDKGPDPMGQ
jgi:hypothetical protein